MRHDSPTAGFTLIELIVALTLSGLALGLVAGSVWTAIETRFRQAESVEAEHRARVTREFLREAVRGMAVERGGRDELIVLDHGRAARGTPSARLHFSTRGGSVFGWETDLKVVELLIDEDPATRHTGLVARVLRTQAGDAVNDTLSLLPTASGLAVRLLDGEGKWRGEWSDRTRAPAAVEFRFLSSSGPQSESRLQDLPLQVRVP